MNREQIIETMARGMVDYKLNQTPPSGIVFARSDAKAALSALEAAGLVVVPVESGEMFVRNRELKGVTIHDFPDRAAQEDKP